MRSPLTVYRTHLPKPRYKSLSKDNSVSKFQELDFEYPMKSHQDSQLQEISTRQETVSLNQSFEQQMKFSMRQSTFNSRRIQLLR